jgi:hypothetical protein
VAAVRAQEAAAGLGDPEAYRRFGQRLAEMRERVANAVAAETGRGHRIAGYGASVGSVTLINQFGLGRVLAFVVDDKPLTAVLVGPDYRIPVVPADALHEGKADLVIILAWRYAQPIMAKNQRFLDGGGRFAVPWPEFSIHGQGRA